MSYRLITRAVLIIVAATGDQSTREVEVRAYPAPKRDAAGAITVDGRSESYKRTGGKGRGTADRRYAYATVKGESAYFEITEREAQAMVGGTVTLASIAVAAPVVAAPVVAPAPDLEVPSELHSAHVTAWFAAQAAKQATLGKTAPAPRERRKERALV